VALPSPAGLPAYLGVASTHCRTGGPAAHTPYLAAATARRPLCVAVVLAEEQGVDADALHRAVSLRPLKTPSARAKQGNSEEAGLAMTATITFGNKAHELPPQRGREGPKEPTHKMEGPATASRFAKSGERVCRKGRRGTGPMMPRLCQRQGAGIDTNGVQRIS